MHSQGKKVVVVGGGISGLTAGIYALKYGFDVSLYERNISVGGMCTGWFRKGTYIDGCIHWLTESDNGVLNKLWHEIGALSDEVRIHHYDVYCQTNFDGNVVNFYSDIKKLKEELLRYAECDNDRKLVKRFINIVDICKVNAITVNKPYFLWNLWDLAKFLFKILPLLPIIKKCQSMSIADFAKKFKSETLRFAFMNNLAPDNYHFFAFCSTYGGIVSKNSGVPLGGSKAFVERISSRFESLGGKLCLHSDVKEFEVENGHCKSMILSDGTKIEADYFIAACDVHHTLNNLLHGKFQIPDFAERDTHKADSPIYSAFLLTFRTRKPLADIEHNRYLKCVPYDVLGLTYETVYIKHFYYDQSIANDGYVTVQTLITSTEEMYDVLDKMPHDEYKEYKKKLGEQMVAKIYETCGDEYGELEILDVATPLTFNHYCNAYKGTFMTYMMTKHTKQMKVRNNILPIDNLALANQWMMEPGGVPIAAMQGKFAAMTIKYFNDSL